MDKQITFGLGCLVWARGPNFVGPAFWGRLGGFLDLGRWARRGREGVWRQWRRLGVVDKGERDGNGYIKPLRWDGMDLWERMIA
jgi:hypothetical protein